MTGEARQFGGFGPTGGRLTQVIIGRLRPDGRSTTPGRSCRRRTARRTFFTPISVHEAVTESADSGPAEQSDACECKVGTVSERYGLRETLLELETRWTAPADERASVRELATTFNRAVLRAALRDAGRASLGTDVESLYRQLTDDDVSSGTRTAVERRLARDGVPVESVVDDFVSHQSVYLHLTECEQLSYESPTDDRDRVTVTRDRLDALAQRLVVVAEDKLEQLDAGGSIDADSVSVLVDVDVFCDHCNTSYPLDDFLDHDGCDCDQQPS